MNVDLAARTVGLLKSHRIIPESWVHKRTSTSGSRLDVFPGRIDVR